MNEIIEASNIYYNKALECMINKNISEAVELIEKSLEYYAKDIEVLNLMGICQYMLCDFDKAQFYWAKSLEYNNKDNRAQNYLNDFKSTEFIKFVEKYNLAIDNINNKRYKQSLKIIKEVNEFDKELIEPYIMIGFCFLKLKKYDLAKKYIQNAVDKDKGNLRYLIYLNEINDINIRKKKKNVFKGSMVIACLAILVIGSYVKKYNELNKISYEISENQEKIKKYELEVEASKNEFHDYKIDDNYEIIGNEFEIFRRGVLNIKNQEYAKAMNNFQHVINTATEENLIAEATYYMAICFEKNGNYKMTEKYYDEYIRKFNNRNYYDDSLYNYGLILYKQGNKKKAKEILIKLKNEIPDSIFINSKVKYILKN